MVEKINPSFTSYCTRSTDLVLTCCYGQKTYKPVNNFLFSLMKKSLTSTIKRIINERKIDPISCVNLFYIILCSLANYDMKKRHFVFRIFSDVKSRNYSRHDVRYFVNVENKRGKKITPTLGYFFLSRNFGNGSSRIFD